MPKPNKHLGDAELEIMQILWDAPKPITASAILPKLQGRRNWALSTLMSSLARLAEKGFVLCDRSTRTNYYSPLIPAQAYKAQESQSFLARLHGNSLPRLVANLYDSHAIGPEDLSELKAFIEELETEARHD